MSQKSRLLFLVVNFFMASLGLATSAHAAIQNSFYSESTYYEKYDLVTESRLRSLYNWQESENLESGAYLGASLQYQSPDAAQKYYDSAMTPQVGLQFRFVKKVYLQLQAGVRTVIESDSQAEKKTEWDPRVILSTGDMLYASPSSKTFAEYYGEVSFVPRINSTPVSTAWLKLGYRFSPWKNIYADPYAEAFARESRNSDLGPTITQYRAGARLLWWTPSWNVSALLYHGFDDDDATAAIEGLFVVGGNF
jgi:hypothetical protein